MAHGVLLSRGGIKFGIESKDNGVYGFPLWLGFAEWLAIVVWLLCIGVKVGIETEIYGVWVFPFWIGKAKWVSTVVVECVVECGMKSLVKGFGSHLFGQGNYEDQPHSMPYIYLLKF